MRGTTRYPPAPRPSRRVRALACCTLAGAASLVVQACGGPGGTSTGGHFDGGTSTGGGYSGSSSGGGTNENLSGAVTQFGPCQCTVQYEESSCTPENTCAAYLSCEDGLCRPSCSARTSCPYGGACVQQSEGSCNDDNQEDCASDTDGAPGVACLGAEGLCADPCTPLPDSCGANASCSLTDGELDCVARAPSVPSSDCASDGECSAGTTCTPDVGCEPWCRMGAPGDCPADTVCIPLPGPVEGGGSTYGVCRAACRPGESCGDGGKCVIVTPGGTPFVDCVQPTSSYASTSCNGLTCRAGMACRQYSPEQSDCESYCAIPGGSCPAGNVCTPLPLPVVADGVTYGTCTATCDPMSPTSCGDGASCNLFASGGSAVTDCVQAATGVGPYGCSGQLCVPGAQCTEFPDGLSACETYCRVGAQDCSPGFACAALVPAVTLAGPTYGVCQDTCNLTTPADVCGPDGSCIPVVDGTNPAHTACVGYPASVSPSSTLLLGGSCSSDVDCPPGATCAQGTCVAWCEVGPTGHCPGGTSCEATSPSVVIGGVTYGTCL